MLTAVTKEPVAHFYTVTQPAVQQLPAQWLQIPTGPPGSKPVMNTCGGFLKERFLSHAPS